MMLGQELINIFSPEVLVLFDVGSGEMIKAALSQRVLTVGIVANKAHKELIMPGLRQFVQANNLVNIADGAPSKPQALIAFEKANHENPAVIATLKAEVA